MGRERQETTHAIPFNTYVADHEDGHHDGLPCDPCPKCPGDADTDAMRRQAHPEGERRRRRDPEQVGRR